MDLICCRNLLIYLEPALQNKLISLFHYATRLGGFLVLGNSEGIGSAPSLFATGDRSHKIFSKKATAVRQTVSFSLNRSSGQIDPGSNRMPLKQTDSVWNYVEAQKEFDRRVLSQYSPATVFVNDDLEIIHTRGSVNRFLRLMPGRARLSILKMAQEGLLLELRNAIARTKKQNIVVRKENVQIKEEDVGEDGPSSDSQLARTAGFEVTPHTLAQLKG